MAAMLALSVLNAVAKGGIDFVSVGFKFQVFGERRKYFYLP